MKWAQKTATPTNDIRAAYHYFFHRILATARRVPPLPELVPARLLHRPVCDFFGELLSVPSGGAVEQYVAYGLLRAYVSAIDRNLTARTKDRYASDASSRVPGDIQIIRGTGNLVHAFEVTAHAWHDRDKIAQAVEAIERGGLQRVTILGQLGGDSPRIVLERLRQSGLPEHIEPERLNIQVLDLLSTLPVLVAFIPNTGGVAEALRYAYEHIARLPDTQHAIRFVALCHSLGFTA